MAASSTWTQPSLSNVSCVSARCTGFAKVRGKNDFAFVVETEWSDQRKQCVKRTFDEFQVLHGCLTKAFSDVKNAEKRLLNLRSGIKDLFTQDRRRLAEIREPIVDAYLRDLTALPEKISRSSLVLTFLEPRDTDPKPVRAHGCPGSENERSSDGSGSPAGEPSGGRALCCGWSDERLQQQPAAHSWKAYRDWCVATVLKSLQQSDSSKSGGGACGSDAAGNEPPPLADAALPVAGGDDGSPPPADADENYFLNVGVQELMLLDSDALASASTQLDSMWCSDFEKFSEILRHNIGAFPLAVAPRRQQKATEPLPGVATSGDMTESTYQPSYADDDGADECSDTESQLMERSYYVDNDADGSGLESDDEFASAKQPSPARPIAAAID